MRFTRREEGRERDDLHVIGLARIPRCAACRRFEALRRAHERRSPSTAPLPPVPPTCKYQICSPLVARCSPSGEPQD
jgi:hypothetical protein